MAQDNSQSVTHLDIGLSREEQARIEALRQVNLDKKKKTFIVSLSDWTNSLTRIKLREKVTFFQLLAVMINAGVPIIRSLYVLSDQLQNIKLQSIIRELAHEMENGTSLSNAMEAHPNLFTEAERGMVASGEASGNLNEILNDMAAQSEKSAAILAKVKGAMIYPTAIIVIMTLALAILLTVVVPQLEDLFVGSGQELPTSTKILLTSSDWLQNNWPTLVAGIALILGGTYVFRKHPKLKLVVDHALIRIPIFGGIIRELMVSRFHRMLASLMNAGLPIVQALEINSKAIGNKVYEKRISYASQDVAQGIPLGENLTSSDFLFPPMVATMVRIGEQTANLEEVAGKVADYYEERVDNAVAGLSKLMEPVILVVMGAVVGLVVAAVMQPIMALSDLSSVL